MLNSHAACVDTHSVALSSWKQPGKQRQSRERMREGRGLWGRKEEYVCRLVSTVLLLLLLLLLHASGCHSASMLLRTST